jgi:putative transcriptional regulator
MAARARIGVGGLEEAVSLLEERHSKDGPTRFRFSLLEDGLVAEVEEREPAGVRGSDASAGAANVASWRTVVELVS